MALEESDLRPIEQTLAGIAQSLGEIATALEAIQEQLGSLIGKSGLAGSQECHLRTFDVSRD